MISKRINLLGEAANSHFRNALSRTLATPDVVEVPDDDDSDVEIIGYRPQLHPHPACANSSTERSSLAFPLVGVPTIGSNIYVSLNSLD